MVPTHLPWPKKGNKAFVSIPDGREIHLPSIQPLPWTFPQHASVFKTAAETIIDAHENGSRVSHPDELFFPVAFLYRHCLELKLKDLIRVGIQTNFFLQKDVAWTFKAHGLAQLWTPVKRLLLDGWPDADPSPILAVEAVIAELHQADPNGQTFRYESDAEGDLHRHERLPEFISLTNLRSTIDNVYTFLDCSEGCLRENLDRWNDA
jgi:hypothetical protein